jgi:hypothetical protein
MLLLPLAQQAPLHLQDTTLAATTLIAAEEFSPLILLLLLQVPLKGEPQDCAMSSVALTLVAGKLSIAFASSASSLSNTGVPSPLGQLRTTQVTSPPQDSPLVRTALMAAEEAAG